mgnify:CR=1 FL=1
MERTDILIDLVNSKASLQIADRTIQAMNQRVRKLNNKCIRKNLLIGGLIWFGATTCKMLGESDKKRKEAEEYARKLEVVLTHTQQVLDEVNRKNAEQFWAENSAGEPEPEKDICCDGKATVTKKPE